MVLTGYGWTVGETGEKNSVFKSTPIGMDEALITYPNYLQLITGESVTKEASSTRPTGHRLYDV